MKTYSNRNLILEIAMVATLAITFSTTLPAQPGPAGYGMSEIQYAAGRLEVVMASVEQNIKYVAPEVFPGEIQFSLDRLELMAASVENEIRYVAPREERFNEPVVAAQENNPANGLLQQNDRLLSSVGSK